MPKDGLTSVGLIQRQIEAEGIRTASIMNLLKVGQALRPPRILHVPFPLGQAFGGPGEKALQTRILKEIIDFSLAGGAEEVRDLG